MTARKKENLYFYRAPFGRLTLASDGECLTGLWIDGQKYDRATLEQSYTLQEQEKKAIDGKADALAESGRISVESADVPPVIADTIRWLELYFAGKQPGFLPPLKPKGSAFRQEVWQILQTIPYGQITTYKKIAEEIAAAHGKKSMSAQAVGGAVGHNPISILIPCHRVLGTDGSLTGYAGGLAVKEYLLKLERTDGGEIN